MGHLHTPKKTGSVISSDSTISLKSSSTIDTSTATDQLISPCVSPSIKVDTEATIDLHAPPKVAYSPHKVVKAASTRSSPPPIRASTKPHDARIEMAIIRIASLRQSNSQFKITIAELQNDNKNVKLCADAALAHKDEEIKILKSNAWMDTIALRQKDEEIAALRRCIESNNCGVSHSDNETMTEAQRLNHTIVDLSRVKKELMEEISELEIKKEDLEFS